MTGRQGGLAYRVRYSLWLDGAEVPGGPYYRTQAAERAAEQILARHPAAQLHIQQEQMQVVKAPGATHSGDVIRQWVATEVVWSNPNAEGAGQ